MIKNLLIDKKKRILFKIFELKKRFLKTVIFDKRFLIYYSRLSFFLLCKFFFKAFNNFCIISGRSNSVYSSFGLSRMELKKLINLGFLYGIRKSSW